MKVSVQIEVCTSNRLHQKSTLLGKIFTTVRILTSSFCIKTVSEFTHTLVGISRITKEEASRLVNYTYRLPGDEDHYVIQLDVFHQLHCLVCFFIFFIFI